MEKGNAGQRGWLRDVKPEEKGFVWWCVRRRRAGTLLTIGRRGKGLWHDIGYVAAFVQLCAATIFWVATM